MSQEAAGANPVGAARRMPIHLQVQDAIKNYILAHGLAPGDALPSEGQLSELLGVIEARVGRGLFVRPFSLDPLLNSLPYSLLIDLDTVGHLLHLREVLDQGCSGQIIDSVSAEQLGHLRAILKE